MNDKLKSFLGTDSGKAVAGAVGAAFLMLLLWALTPKSVNINVYGAGNEQSGKTAKTGVKHLWSGGKP